VKKTTVPKHSPTIEKKATMTLAWLFRNGYTTLTTLNLGA
jgi:hypothetical protein